MRNFSLPIFGYEEISLEFGQKNYIFWDYSKVHHILVFGNSGGGKTYFLKSLLGSVAMHVPNACITVCDYKAEDFSFLEGCNKYHYFDGCLVGLRSFYKAFQRRQCKEDRSRNFQLLVFDEWAAFVSNLDKKEADEAKSILSSLLMLGRAFNVHVIVSQQRADAKYFDTARDNFSVIVAMGNISKESVQMFFSEYKEEIRHDKVRGTGHILIDGIGLNHIYVPQVRNMNKLHYYIRQVVS